MRRALLCTLLSCMLLLCACSRPAQSVVNTPRRQTLTVYTSHWEEIYAPIVQEFQERTGIWVFVEQGGTAELMERLSEESGDVRCDIIFGGGAETHEAYAQLLQPYESAGLENVAQQYHAQGNLWTAFSVLPVVIIYNEKLVPAPPTSWEDLLDSRFASSIAFANPAASGSGFTALATLLQGVGGDKWDTLERFAAQLQGGMAQGSSYIVSDVADGRYAVGVTLEEAAYRQIQEGVQIGVVYPGEGTSLVPDATSLVKGAPNEEAAKLFIDFTISRDVQQMLAEDFGRRPVYSGIEGPAGLPGLESIPELDYDYVWCIDNREEILWRWQREF